MLFNYRAEEMDEIKQKGGNEKSKDPSKRVTFSLPNDSDTEEEIDMFQAKRNSSAETKSSFEKRQEKVNFLLHPTKPNAFISCHLKLACL